MAKRYRFDSLKSIVRLAQGLDEQGGRGGLGSSVNKLIVDLFFYSIFLRAKDEKEY